MTVSETRGGEKRGRQFKTRRQATRATVITRDKTGRQKCGRQALRLRVGGVIAWQLDNGKMLFTWPHVEWFPFVRHRKSQYKSIFEKNLFVMVCHSGFRLYRQELKVFVKTSFVAQHGPFELNLVCWDSQGQNWKIGTFSWLSSRDPIQKPTCFSRDLHESRYNRSLVHVQDCTRDPLKTYSLNFIHVNIFWRDLFQIWDPEYKDLRGILSRDLI